MTRRDSILITALFGVVSTFGGCGLTGCADTQKMQAEIDYTRARLDTLEKLVARMTANDAKAAAALAEALRQIRLSARAGTTEGGDE